MTHDTKVTKFDFSKYKTYKDCPLAYKWKYVEKRVPKKVPNKYYALPGIVIQKMFEHFYNDEWFLKRGACREFMYNKAPEIYESILKWCHVDWTAKISKKTKHDVFDEFLEMIGKNLDVIKEHKLLGKIAKSEHTIISNFDNNNFVVLKSKIDFFIKNQDGIIILDGKATSNKKNYLNNPEQLHFYAMMCKTQYNAYPDKLGFWWWRDATITYLDYGQEDIDKLKQSMGDILYKIYKNKFDATPNYSTCMFCDYQDECTEKTRHAAEKQAEKAIGITELDILNDFN